MGKRMNWEMATRRERARPRPEDVELIPVQADESFWESWRRNRVAMRAAGYRVTKAGNQWRVFVERRVSPDLESAHINRVLSRMRKWPAGTATALSDLGEADFGGVKSQKCPWLLNLPVLRV